MNQDNATAIARERADARIDAALGELHKAAREIGSRYGIPDGIAGHSIEELLGRMAYVPSMARDLRRVTGQELAKDEMRQVFEERAKAPESPPTRPGPDPVVMPGAGVDVANLRGSVPVSLDVAQLPGITPQAVKALKSAGLHDVGAVIGVPDEHLLKISGLADKSVQQIRAAIALLAGGPAP